MKRMLATAAFAITVPAVAAQATNTLLPVGAPDKAQIITLVSSIPMAVDLAAYDLTKAAFAPEIIIDYTSLWGGEPAKMTPADLMSAWRGIVPGFDATWHELGPITVEIDGTDATAIAFVDGRHWIGDDLWRPIGTYHWDVAQVEGEWRVTRMVFNMTDEIGDRALAAQAMERAAASN